MNKTKGSPARILLVQSAFLVLIVLGASLLWFQSTAFIRANQSQKWPKTTAVLSVETGQYRKSLTYCYSVDGVSYESDRVIFGELGNKRPSDEWIQVSHLPDQSMLEVFYMPDNPKVSTVIPKVRAGGGFNLLIGFFLLLIGGIGLFFRRLSTSSRR